jgi:MFS family permease
MVVSPPAGQLADKRGAKLPVQIGLGIGVVVSLLAPILRPLAALMTLLIAGMPALGALFTPANSLISKGADNRGLNHGLSYGLANFAWAGRQAIAAVASGALAEATSDVVPYGLLAFACLGTIALVQVSGRGAAPVPDT